MRVFTPPNQIDYNSYNYKVFLAGTIDMGNSENWQKKLIEKLYNDPKLDIYNPRRDDWDSTWTQTFENPQFFQQVMWELDAMNKADRIIMNFLPESKSPITLLELGLYANSGKLHVCCPDEFWRAGNVHIICNQYNIPLFKNFEDLLKRNNI
jgi:hypothetical protein